MASPSPYETIHDLTVDHRVGLGRYSTWVVRRVLAQLKRIDAQLVARIQAADLTEAQAIRLEQLLEGIGQIQAEGWGIIAARVEADLEALAEVEIEFAIRIVRVAVDAARANSFTAAPALSQVVAAVKARPFSKKLLREWLSDAEEGAKRRVREAIRQGVVEGQTIDEMVRAIRGTRARRYQDGILDISRRGAEAMVRTAVTHTSATAHEETYRQNADVVKGVIWTSTLDNRTTVVCMARSEKVYPINRGPRPPAHINCRSTTRPLIRPIPGVAPYKAESYQEWLARQPEAVQNDILGPKRARLYRAGMGVDKFVDRAGETLTLDQLRARDADAFARAGL